jgi:histidyl-tRNA synthetase
VIPEAVDSNPGAVPFLQAPRGTHDILPHQISKWQQIEGALQGVVERAGYREIRTPVIEHTELYQRGVGDTTDIVRKEMYTFSDRSDRSLTLRPEGTAGVVRAYLSNGLNQQAAPVKLWYKGPMFRYEQTQAGRQRQFNQMGIEVFGCASPLMDAEVIVLALDAVGAAGVTGLRLHLNSIGCKNCRQAFRTRLQEFARPKLGAVCEDCRERFERNPMRMLDCKVDKARGNYNDAPSLLDALCAECSTHWNELLKYLQALGVSPVIDPALVRGLDYYSRTVFELITDDARLGAQSTICAGGRYDPLLESLGGPPTAAIGWAAGLERLCLLVSESRQWSPQVFVVASDSAAGLNLAMLVRRAGFSCELDFPAGGKARGFGKQMQKANKVGAQVTLILGEDEVAGGTISIKTMSTGVQTKIPASDLLQFLAANCSAG